MNTYTYEERKKAVELYLQYGKRATAVIRELGYPSRGMLYNWVREFEKTGALHDDDSRKYLKFTKEQRKQAIEYYLTHGKSISVTIKALGFPRRTAMRKWVQEDLPDEEKHCLANKTLIKCTKEQKEQAVIKLCAGDGTAKKIAAEAGVSESTLYIWKKRLRNEGCHVEMSKKKSAKPAKTEAPSEKSLSELETKKETLTREVEDLEEKIFRLQLEHDILEKADEILKKDRGINPKTLTNREKAVLIDALRNKYRLKTLLNVLNMAKSSYCYQETVSKKSDKYAELRSRIKIIFSECYDCYGYRRIHAVLQQDGFCVSEKVIRRIMREEQLFVLPVKKKKYNSYKGEISPEVENVINRDFSADAPNKKWLTDITEFSLSAGKVYLSPIIDCFDGMAVSWTIGTSPDAELVNTMLDTAVSELEEGERPIVHSDRGCHYRWPGWIERMAQAELPRSMSKKGCSPDNSACEGFFGRLKNEMFYGRSWFGVSISEFIQKLDVYIRWYNETRIKMSLGAMSPLVYRKSLGLLKATPCI
jgi:transposase InsO family protein/transposase-like protein